jgi:hypothetical protein
VVNINSCELNKSEGAQVLHAKNGEQLSGCSSSSCSAAEATVEVASSHESWQQGTKVSVTAMTKKNIANHFFKV